MNGIHDVDHNDLELLAAQGVATESSRVKE